MEGLTFSYREGDDPEFPSVVQTIMLRGRPVGYVDAQMDEGSGHFQVMMSQLSDPALRGKGIGALAYVDLWQYVKRKYGMGLASDTTRSEPAERLWQKLQSQGKARPKTIRGKSAYVMEGALEDHRLSFSVRTEGPRVAQIQVGELRDQSGRVVGSIRATESDSFPDGSVWQISHSGLDKSLRGKGIGGAMYRAMQQQLRSRGQFLASDLQRSPEAEQLWKALVQKGEARTVSQDGSTIYVMR